MSFVDENDKKLHFLVCGHQISQHLLCFVHAVNDWQLRLAIIDSMYKKYKDDINFVMINIVDGSREKLGAGQKYFADKGYDFTYYYVNNLIAADSVGVKYIPTMYVLDKDGEIKFAYEVNQSQNQLESNFKAVI